MQFYPASSPLHPLTRSTLLRRRRVWPVPTDATETEPDPAIGGDEPEGPETDDPEDLDDEDLLVGAIHRAARIDETAATLAVGALTVDGGRGTDTSFVRLIAAGGSLALAARGRRGDGGDRPATVRSGPTVFRIADRADDAGEMVLIRMDTAPTTIVRLALRVDEGGPVDVTPSNSVQGTTETSVVDLAQGHYLLLYGPSGRLPSGLTEQPSAVA